MPENLYVSGPASARAERTGVTSPASVIAFFPGEGTEFRVAADRFVRKGDASQRSEAFAVVEYEGAPNLPGPPAHLHRAFEEAWYILDGDVEFITQGGRTRATRGTYLFVPRGVAHTFRVLGDRPARWIGIFSPGRYVGLVEELGPLFSGGGPPDQRAIAQLFARYDTELAPVGP